jgi:hypothetical protein
LGSGDFALDYSIPVVSPVDVENECTTVNHLTNLATHSLNGLDNIIQHDPCTEVTCITTLHASNTQHQNSLQQNPIATLEQEGGDDLQTFLEFVSRVPSAPILNTPPQANQPVVVPTIQSKAPSTQQHKSARLVDNASTAGSASAC